MKENATPAQTHWVTVVFQLLHAMTGSCFRVSFCILPTKIYASDRHSEIDYNSGSCDCLIPPRTHCD